MCTLCWLFKWHISTLSVYVKYIVQPDKYVSISFISLIKFVLQAFETEAGDIVVRYFLKFSMNSKSTMDLVGVTLSSMFCEWARMNVKIKFLLSFIILVEAHLCTPEK